MAGNINLLLWTLFWLFSLEVGCGLFLVGQGHYPRERSIASVLLSVATDIALLVWVSVVLFGGM
jgi:hypothetical protein